MRLKTETFDQTERDIIADVLENHADNHEHHLDTADRHMLYDMAAKIRRSELMTVQLFEENADQVVR